MECIKQGHCTYSIILGGGGQKGVRGGNGVGNGCTVVAAGKAGNRGGRGLEGELSEVR
jgi:hypothetical protein